MSAAQKRRLNTKKILAGSVRFVKGKFRSVFQKSIYDIKRGYIHRISVKPHDDRGSEEENQKEVYQYAAQLMDQHALSSVIDIGCGSGFKLIKYLGKYSTLGVDFDPAISDTATKYPQHRWMNAKVFHPVEHTANLIICADTIEHVPDPDAFMQSIISIGNWKYLLISTPERNLKRGWYHFGPSPNESHYREWSSAEFNRFVSNYCRILQHEIINTEQGTQLLICQPIDSK